MWDLYSTKRKRGSKHFISEKKNLSRVKKTNSEQHKHVTHAGEVTGQTSEGKEWLINQLSVRLQIPFLILWTSSSLN